MAPGRRIRRELPQVHGRIMMRVPSLFPTAAALLVAVAGPAGAQNPDVSGTDPFCGLTGSELLASLDGGWTLHQGPREILYPIPHTLPPPPPIAIRFAYDAEEGVVNADAADLSDGIIMYPAGGPTLGVTEDYIEVASEVAIDSGCEWSSSPILIGTNSYFSLGSEYVAWMMTQDYCELARANFEAHGGESWATERYRETYRCDRPEPQREDFEMEMTLLLRFQTPGFGAGMVFFEGEADGVGFGARSTVTISRN